MTSNFFNKEDVDLSLLILCPCCKNVYSEPVILPCGQSICKSHVKDSLTSKNNKQYFNCGMCKKEHEAGVDGSFPVNEKVDDLVKKCQVRATPIKEIYKTANESYNKLTSNSQTGLNLSQVTCLFFLFLTSSFPFVKV